MRLTKNQVKKFQQKVYSQPVRRFPWRKTINPYHILVSEIMLQQTQADRVVAKYTQFIKKFPTVKVLARASLVEVLKAWQGLGYNRRAKMLHQAAQAIISNHHGKVPKTVEQLDGLPGVGPYTAAAVMAFAYNQPGTFVETNIRTVFIHEFFPKKKKVGDKELLPFVKATLDYQHPCRWYTALMDYGTVLKRQHKNPSRRSATYARQSKFIGSNRQIRGAVIRELSTAARLTQRQLLGQLPFEPARLKSTLASLVHEGLIHQSGQQYFL